MKRQSELREVQEQADAEKRRWESKNMAGPGMNLETLKDQQRKFIED